MIEEKKEKSYELAYWLSSRLSEDNLKEEEKKIKEMILNNGGQIAQSNLSELKDLFYPIKHETKGYFGVINFTLEPEKLKNLNKEWKFNANILRFLITILMPEKAKPIRKNIFKKKISPRPEVQLTPELSAKTEGGTINFDDLDKKLEEILHN